MDRLQWGSRKRPRRCAKVKNSRFNGKSGVVKNRSMPRSPRRVENNISNYADTTSKDGSPLPPVPSPHLSNREMAWRRSVANDENHRASTSLSSHEKEDKYYTTGGSGRFDSGSKKAMAQPKEETGKIVWPKLLITLSSKEKEEDFMAIKGCKPPQRPKKRAKLIQRTILLVSPGAWLTDLCQERYRVREKMTTSKKKPRGLKAMGSVESDSEW